MAKGEKDMGKITPCQTAISKIRLRLPTCVGGTVPFSNENKVAHTQTKIEKKMLL